MAATGSKKKRNPHAKNLRLHKPKRITGRRGKGSYKRVKAMPDDLLPVSEPSPRV
jgi:hypothetical protein